MRRPLLRIPLLMLSFAAACAGGAEMPEPEPEPRPVPTRARPEPVDDYNPIRAPLEPNRPTQPDIDLSKAEAMEVQGVEEPVGEPVSTLSLLMASRGDGEIEPCG